MDKADLLKKFLSNACNEEEAKLAMQYLEEEPGLMDEILNKAEWDDIDTSAPLMPVLENEIKGKIYRKTYQPVYRVLKPTLASAAMLAVIFFGFMYFNKTEKIIDNNIISTAEAQISSTNKVENNTQVIKVLTLADNSTVHLYPGSSIIYERAFADNRKIQLSGKAIFSVTKNTESPFVVYSGEISTTALGTKFLVDNSNDISRVNVKLFEGRVVIQPADGRLQIQQTYLEAGQQCFVDIKANIVKVESIFASRQLAQKIKSTLKKRNVTAIVNENEILEFSKMPMPQVLNNLKKVFGREIYFNKDDMDENLFTGSFSVKDSLMNILRTIAVMNDMQIDLKGDSINVSKKIKNVQQQNKAAVYDQHKGAGKIPLQQKMALPELTLSLPAGENIPVSQPNKEMVVGESGIVFTGISLPGLFAELQKQTKRKIYFNEEELQHINFTGSISYKNSVGSTLSAICLSNGLKLTIKNRSYYISKDK
jgi:Fe2+-dicitrate sensor, membrane component